MKKYILVFVVVTSLTLGCDSSNQDASNSYKSSSQQATEQPVADGRSNAYDHYLTSIGGLDNLSDLNKWAIKYTTRMRDDVNKMEIKVDACRDMNKYSVTINNNQLPRVIRAGFDGDEYWIDSPTDESVGGGTRLFSKAEFDAMFLEIALLLPNLGNNNPLVWEDVKNEAINGQQYYVGTTKLNPEQDVVCFFNSTTGRMERAHYTQSHDFGETKFDLLFSDFVTPGTLESIAKIQEKSSDGPIEFVFETKIDTFKLNPEFELSDFEVPDSIRK